MAYRGRADDSECTEMRLLVASGQFDLWKIPCFTSVASMLCIKMTRQWVWWAVNFAYPGRYFASMYSIRSLTRFVSIEAFFIVLPVEPQVLTLIGEQMNRVEEPIHALLLVGGFAGSEYLKQRVEVYISPFPCWSGWHLYQGNVCVENWDYCETTWCRHSDIARSGSIWPVKKTTCVICYSTSLVYDQGMFFPDF